MKIAEQAAKWIKTTELPAPGGKVWEQSPDSDEDFSDYPMLTPTALYGGSAGIGLFYLRLYQATGKEAYLEEARAAAGHLMTLDVGEGFYQKILGRKKERKDKLVHVKNMPGWEIGFYNGPTGWAYLARKLYDVTGEERYKAYVLKVMDGLLAAARQSEDGIYWSGQNDLCGDAGFVIHLISAWELSGDGKYLDAAKSFGDFLLTKAAPAPRGGR